MALPVTQGQRLATTHRFSISWTMTRFAFVKFVLPFPVTRDKLKSEAKQ